LLQAASPETFGYTLVFGLKKEEVTGSWRRLNNEDLHNLYTLINIIMVSNHGV
jgi:hypothetical protein